MEKEYKKSYKGFIIWLIAFCVFSIGMSALPIFSKDIPLEWYMRILGIAMVGGMDILCWMMWYREQIYWINGISFEEALQAGSEKRKNYAARVLHTFVVWSIVYLGYIAFGILVTDSVWAEIIAMTLAVCIPAFRICVIKLDEC